MRWERITCMMDKKKGDFHVKANPYSCVNFVSHDAASHESQPCDRGF